MPLDPTGASEPGRLPLPPQLSPRGRRAARAQRSRGRRATRYASWVAVTASALVLVLSGAAYAYYVHLNGNISRESVFDRIKGHRPAAARDGAENILVVGDDSRVGETAAELRAESTTDDGGSNNTDTIIILHLAPNNGPATLISIPRDSFVPIPGHGTFKINSAYADGESKAKGDGPALLTQTVENLSGLHIDHFISVGLGQFINISNAIGGVKVCVVNPSLRAGYIKNGNNQFVRIPSRDVGGAFDPYSGISLSPGVSTISGSQALAFVRQRHGLPDGDIDRIKRQQRFITAIVAKAKGERNPATINAVLEKVTKSLTVDSGLSLIGLAQLGDRLKNLQPADIRFATVPVANIGAMTPSGVSYVQLDMPKLATFFANVKAERDPNAAAPTPAVTPVPPADVHLSVLNGSGVGGGAGRARTALQQYGFVVASVGNASRTSTTEIRYNAADASAAQELGRAVPSATLVPDSSVPAGGVELVLGSNYAGVQDPAAAATHSATPTPTPTPSASSTAPGTTTAGGLLSGADTEDGVPCGP